ncbi:MAG: hypothetical protein WKF59_11475 [Chitinophagaceae bacterium]
MPSNTTVTATRVNQSVVNKTTAYSYNGQGLLASVTNFDGTALASVS